MSTMKMDMLLEEKTYLRELLFSRGFLFTNDNKIALSEYPFYGQWNHTTLMGYTIAVHSKQKLYVANQNSVGMALVGHAYNPVSANMEISETEIINRAIEIYVKSEQEFHEYFNQWTGIFALFVIEDNAVRIYGDAAGMYTVFYGINKGYIYCASHTNLLGDICQLEFDEYINRLIGYKFYPLFGKALPGDLTPYATFKRLIPNHYVNMEEEKWTAVRFFPTKRNALLDMPYDSIIESAADILSNSMDMIHKKWKRPAVSLTGGCDSKTTLACANGKYDKYRYFSYISSDSEAVDAKAAEQICDVLSLSHSTYVIPENDDEFRDICELKKIMEYNSGCIGLDNDNDVRKRAYFLKQDAFDVEVKSWVSEIVRGYYHKRFAKKHFPEKLTPRYATLLYKVFFHNRKLVRDTDKVFDEFLSKYYPAWVFDLIPWYDLFFWEFRMSSWNGLVITGEQQIAYDITIPYNNRILLQLLLSTPIEKRVKDEPHRDIMRFMNPKIADCGISVVNVKHTENRAKLEKVYLEFFSRVNV